MKMESSSFQQNKLKGLHTEFVISTDAENISRSSNTCVGKLRSNFLGNKFMLYDTQQPPHTTCEHVRRTNWRIFNSKVSPKVPTGISYYGIGQITYEIKDLTEKPSPRRIHCVMHSVPVSTLEDSICRMSLSSKSSLDNPTEVCSPRFSDRKIEEVESMVKLQPLVLKNKAPRWNEKGWYLDFKGRVAVASVKNFQLLAAADIGPTTAVSQPSQSDHDKIILQFGRVGKDMFTMDYKYPLSAFQAFAVCLSSFDSKLLCE